jgi:hypothetical protein
MSNLNEKLNKLKGQFDEVPQSLVDYEKQANEAGLFTYLLQFDGMKKFFDILEGKIKGINHELQENVNLDEDSRKAMFIRKDCYREVMKIFTDKQKQLEGIEKYVNEELKEE